MARSDLWGLPGVAALVLALAAPAAAREVTARLTYPQRIALPPDARLVLDLTGPGGPAGSLTQDPVGAQVPLPVTLTVPDGQGLVLRAALFVGGRPAWFLPAVPLPADAGPVDLGVLRLDPHLPMGFARHLTCGLTTVELGFLDDIARLRVGGETFDLRAMPAASGARYSDGAEPPTEVHTRGNNARVTLRGADLPECSPALDPAPVPLAARGHEPDWALDLTAAALTHTAGPGAAPVVTPPPAPIPDGLGWRITRPDGGLTALVEPRLCRDSMTGLPHPLTVTLAEGDRAMTGCGGDPAAVLVGSWAVTHVAGAAVPPGAEARLTLDPAQGRMWGRAFCNRFTGALALGAEGLRLGPAAATRMACDPGLMTLEQALFRALDATTGFDRDGDGALLLRGASGVLLRAVRVGG
ncbi:MAG: META domain-containing protein [Rhodobacterales bacterium]|nr:META domain-containing protein [Rhodobacterales bacterium]